MSVGLGLRFCAALSGFPDLVDFIAETAPDRLRGRLARFLDGFARALATTAGAGSEAVLGKGREGRCRRDRDELRDQRTLEQLDEGVAHIFVGARAAAAA